MSEEEDNESRSGRAWLDDVADVASELLGAAAFLAIVGAIMWSVLKVTGAI